jgi:hypothetical protein
VQPSICQCQWLFCSVLRGAQAVRFDPHLSHLIYIYKSKIIKYMYMVQCPIHRNRKVVIHHQGSYESHSHIHESTHFILFALLKVHPRFFPRLACGPPKLMGPGALPRLIPLSVGLRLVKYT